MFCATNERFKGECRDRIMKLDAIKMIPVSRPDGNSQTVLTYSEEMRGTVVRSTGDVNFRCGRCKRALLEQIGREQYRHVIFKCPGCATYNALPSGPHLVQLANDR